MLYRWPQGRVIRTIFLVLSIAIAVDLGWKGAWAQYVAYDNQQQITSLVGAIIFGVLAAVSFFGGIAAIGFVPKTAQFMIEVEQEMARVTWPGRPEVVRATIIITIMTIVLALIIFLVDLTLSKAVMDGLFSLGKG
ncbi:MAG: preprotein translocase subunit SecE [Planctomycetota bacterium]|jgi:preprotein translocase SecE subunit|nr:preprotein translocase subunit SecE [Planctomycetota bacterium]